MKEKSFRDSVHGNIGVSSLFCRAFIDTPIFQRLRFIGQSTMDALFPTASHTRFAHSLGVFAIAKQMFTALEPQVVKDVKDRRFIDELRNTFLAAALLHDCAHSPFSHTGEKCVVDYCGDNVIRELLLDEVGSDDFRADFYNSIGDGSVRYAVHELASAFVACREMLPRFSRLKSTEEKDIDCEQFARMIIGLKNANTKSLKNRVWNCFVSLINGFIVDADRLDYLQRDTWATGICNASVDMERLINGLWLDLKNGHVVVRKKALSALVNAVNARDFIYEWVITHHKIDFANVVLKRAIEALVKVLAKKKSNKCNELKLGALMFSPERLLVNNGRKKLGEEMIYLPTDGDLLHLMKKYIPNNIYFRAYYYRSNEYLPLWKSHVDFEMQFLNHFVAEYDNRINREQVWEKFNGRMTAFCKNHGNKYIFIKADEIKITKRKATHIDVLLDDNSNECVTYDLFNVNAIEPKFYFNAFVKSEGASSSEFLEEANNAFRESLDRVIHGK